MNTQELQKWVQWKNLMRNIGVPADKMGEAVGMAIEGRWISPGTGNMSTDASLKRMKTTLKKHGIEITWEP